MIYFVTLFRIDMVTIKNYTTITPSALDSVSLLGLLGLVDSLIFLSYFFLQSIRHEMRNTIPHIKHHPTPIHNKAKIPNNIHAQFIKP